MANETCCMCDKNPSHREATRAASAPVCLPCYQKIEALAAEAQEKRDAEYEAKGLVRRGSKYEWFRDWETNRDRAAYDCARCGAKVGFDDVNLKPHTFEDCFNHVIERLSAIESRLDNHNL